MFCRQRGGNNLIYDTFESVYQPPPSHSRAVHPQHHKRGFLERGREERRRRPRSGGVVRSVAPTLC